MQSLVQSDWSFQIEARENVDKYRKGWEDSSKKSNKSQINPTHLTISNYFEWINLHWLVEDATDGCRNFLINYCFSLVWWLIIRWFAQENFSQIANNISYIALLWFWAWGMITRCNLWITSFDQVFRKQQFYNSKSYGKFKI